MRPENAQNNLFLEAPVWWEGLSPRQKRFVETYCTDKACFLNATAAYTKAYGAKGAQGEANAGKNAARLLRDPLVKQSVALLLKAAQAEEDRLSEHQVLGIIKTLTTYNPADIVDKHGRLKLKPDQDLKDLGPLAMCIQGIKPTKYGTEVKLYDRTKTAAMLAQYLDLIRLEDTAGKVNPVVYLNDKADEGTGGGRASMAEDAEYAVIGGEAGK